MTRISRPMVALALVVTAALLFACDAKTEGAAMSNGGQVAPAQKGPGANQAAGDASKVSALPADRRSELATSFPIEVPVPDGMITRADAQGDSAWVYEVGVNAQPLDVAAWYRSAYGSANWQIVRDEVTSNGGTLIFVKGSGAQSKIRLTTEAGGTKITASVGVGEPVGQTL